MSILEGVLIEEYERLKRFLSVYQEKLNGLPKGCLIQKKINGKFYFYLQYREGNKVLSQYVPANQVDELKEKIAERQRYNKRIREVKSDLKKIRKVVGPLVE